MIISFLFLVVMHDYLTLLLVGVYGFVLSSSVQPFSWVTNSCVGV